jgi:Ser/Thr protein kinase RdoA (MazF antagonist)
MIHAGDADEVAAIFALGADASLTGPVARGEQGQVWRLTSSAGAFAIKESFDPQSAEDAALAATFQERVQTAGVLVPRIVRSRSGNALEPIGTGEVRVYAWVDLADPDPWVDPVAVGRLIAAIHLMRLPDVRPVDPWYVEPVGADRWDGLVSRLRDRDAPFADRLAGLRDELVILESFLTHPTEPQTCHRDLWADNIRATAFGLCVIDWDNSGPASTDGEIAQAMFEFGRTPDRARSLYAAYVDAGGPGRLRRRTDFTTVIGQLGHIGEMAFEQWLAAESDADRTRALGRVEEFLGEPLTRDVMDRLLDLVAAM